MSLIAGSYERYVWGFKLRPSEPQALSLTTVFTFPSHLSAIKTIAAVGPVAASGGADDTIHLYDLATASSLGSLHDHSASLTALSFYTPPSLSFPRNLISAASDGSVCIYDADPFVHLKTVFPHKKAINDLSIHPSGKLALTVGHDNCLAMTNLGRGKRSFYCRLGYEASLVDFDIAGDKFFMVREEKVSVHEAEDARLLFELENKKRILCATPCENGILLTGGEDCCVTAWDVKSGKVAYSIEGAHAARIKGIVVLTKNSSGDFSDDDPHIVASASTDGVIRVWDVRTAVKGKAIPLAEAKTESRLTCLAGSTLKSLRRPQMGNKTSDGGQCVSNATDNNKLAE